MSTISNGYPTQEAKAIWASDLTLVEHTTTTAAATTPADNTDGTYAIVDYNGVAAIAKGVRIKGASAGGNLEVHLKDNPASRWTIYDFDGGDKEGLIFDSIRTDATTITLSDVLVLLD